MTGLTKTIQCLTEELANIEEEVIKQNRDLTKGRQRQVRDNQIDFVETKSKLLGIKEALSAVEDLIDKNYIVAVRHIASWERIGNKLDSTGAVNAFKGELKSRIEKWKSVLQK